MIFKIISSKSVLGVAVQGASCVPKVGVSVTSAQFPFISLSAPICWGKSTSATELKRALTDGGVEIPVLSSDAFMKTAFEGLKASGGDVNSRALAAPFNKELDSHADSGKPAIVDACVLFKGEKRLDKAVVFMAATIYEFTKQLIGLAGFVNASKSVASPDASPVPAKPEVPSNFAKAEAPSIPAKPATARMFTDLLGALLPQERLYELVVKYIAVMRVTSNSGVSISDEAERKAVDEQVGQGLKRGFEKVEGMCQVPLEEGMPPFRLAKEKSKREAVQVINSMSEESKGKFMERVARLASGVVMMVAQSYMLENGTESKGGSFKGREQLKGQNYMGGAPLTGASMCGLMVGKIWGCLNITEHLIAGNAEVTGRLVPVEYFGDKTFKVYAGHVLSSEGNVDQRINALRKPGAIKDYLSASGYFSKAKVPE